MNKFPEITLTIHHSAPSGNGRFYYHGRNGKTYTEEEYYKMIRRKELIKEIVLTILQTFIFVIFIVFRAYVFLEYGY